MSRHLMDDICPAMPGLDPVWDAFCFWPMSTCYDVLPENLPSNECRTSSDAYRALQVTAGLQHPASPRRLKATLTSGPHL